MTGQYSMEWKKTLKPTRLGSPVVKGKHRCAF